MSTPSVRRLPAVPAAASAGAAQWLTLLAEGRARTLRGLEGLGAAELDAACPELPVSIGSQLAHLAAIEVDWLWTDLKAEPVPAEEIARFPFADVRDGEGRLSAVRGLSLEEVLALLEQARAQLVAHVAGLSDGALTEPVHGPGGCSTPEWILNHLLQHEAEHRGMIRRMRSWWAEAQRR
jgi:uncharacterized damage-inducible protein DinB